jgi:small conductance mechanosensitive channel
MTEIPWPAPIAPYAPLLVGIFKASVIFTLGWIGGRWAHRLGLRLFRARKIDEAVARFLAAILQYAVLAAALIAALDAVGVATTSLLAVLGSAALAVGLAIQGSLSNFAAGVMLVVFRPFAIDDVVTIAGHTGRVDEIGLFATVLVTGDNHRVVIPNAQVTSGSIVNLTVLGTRRGTIPIGLAYGSDPARAIQVIEAALVTIGPILREPAPEVRLEAFGAASMDVQVLFWTKSDELSETLHDTRMAIHGALERAGIEIAFARPAPPERR